MRQLSPLLQTDEIKDALNTAIQEGTRVRFGAHESSAGNDDDKENCLILIRKIISGDINYQDAVRIHKITNHVIADRLCEAHVINEKQRNDLKACFRTRAKVFKSLRQFS